MNNSRGLWVVGMALAGMVFAELASAAGSGSGSGGTTVDSAVQAGGESSSKSSGGLTNGLEQAFGVLTIDGGLALGDVAAPEFILLGDRIPGGDVVIATVADDGTAVVVTVRDGKIVSIERDENPRAPAKPLTKSCS